MGAALSLEAWLYGAPLLIGLPLLERCKLLQPTDSAPIHSWKWTAQQSLAAAACLYGVVSLRCEFGSDFIYFQF